jgi:glutamyl/glutaminyl-tRNA synthetase
VQDLQRAGFLPEAVRNYLALLGWGYDESTTFFSTDELIEKFELERVSRSPAVFDEQKLRWMNGHYIRALPVGELTGRVARYLSEQGLPGSDDPRLEQAVAAAQEKISTLADFPDLVGFAFAPPELDERAWVKVMTKDGAGQALVRARESLAVAEPFDEEQVERALRAVVEDLGAKPPAVFQPLRVAITGKTVSPGIFESVVLLGKDETLARIDASLSRL